MEMRALAPYLKPIGFVLDSCESHAVPYQGAGQAKLAVKRPFVAPRPRDNDKVEWWPDQRFRGDVIREHKGCALAQFDTPPHRSLPQSAPANRCTSGDRWSVIAIKTSAA